MQTFMDNLANGWAAEDQIDDAVEEWHESDSDLELHEYLGMSWDEYKDWFELKKTLKEILRGRSSMD